MKPIYIPSVEEGLREYFEEVPEALESLIIEAREAIEGEIREIPFVINIGDLDLLGQGILLMEGCNFMAKHPLPKDAFGSDDWYALKDRLASALIREGRSGTVPSPGTWPASASGIRKQARCQSTILLGKWRWLQGPR